MTRPCVIPARNLDDERVADIDVRVLFAVAAYQAHSPEQIAEGLDIGLVEVRQTYNHLPDTGYINGRHEILYDPPAAS